MNTVPDEVFARSFFPKTQRQFQKEAEQNVQALITAPEK